MQSGQPKRVAISPSRLKERQEISLRLLPLLFQSKPENLLLQEILGELVGIIGVRYGALALIDDAGRINGFIHTGIDAETTERIGQTPTGSGLLGAVPRQSGVVRLADLTQDPRFAGFPSGHPPMKTLLASAITHEGKVLACAYLSEKTDGSTFDEEDEALFHHFTETVAPILAHRRAATVNAGAMAILGDIAHVLSTATGEEFFQQLVLGLWRALGTDYAFVGELINTASVHTAAVCAHGRVVDNFLYKLAGTPCHEVITGQRVCTFARGVQQLFPEDVMLVEMGLDSYIGAPLFDSSGRPLGILVLVDSKPLTNPEMAEAILKICASRAAAELERRRADGQLRLLASAVANTADSVVITDPHGVIQYVNPAYEKTTGYSCLEVLGKNPSILKSGKHDPAFYQKLWDTLLRGEVFRQRFINRRKDGSLYYEEKTITPLKNEKGEVTHFVSTGKDITEHIRTEQAMTRMGRILDQSSNEIYVFDAETLRFLQVNEGARQNLGYTSVELTELTPVDLKPEYSRERFESLLAPLRRGEIETQVFETVHRRKDGTLYPAEVRLQFSRTESPPVFVAVILDISERKRAEEALAKSASEWTHAMDFIEDSICLVDLDDKITRANRAFYQFIRRTPDETIGRTLTSLMHPQGETVLCPVCLARRERRDARITREADDPTNLTGRPTEVVVRIVRNDTAQPSGILVGIHDLTRTRQAQEDLRVSRAGMIEAQRIARMGNWEWDTATHELRCSDEVSRILFGSVPPSGGVTAERLLDSVHPDDRALVMEAVARALHEHQPYSIDYRVVQPDGTERIVHEQAEVSCDVEGKTVRMAGTIQDITESRRAQEHIDYLAYYDTLTGLPNRHLLRDRLNQAMIDGDRTGRIAAILLVDLDRFKYINDTLGHNVGDALLKAVAERLNAGVRAGDTISRLGGDEFAIVLANVAQSDDVARVTQKIIDAFTPPFQIHGHELFVSPSIGIALYPLDGRDVDGLVSNADAAMYHAKETGRNNFQFYTAELNLQTARHLALETSLRRAIERNEFLLHYQPQVNLKTGRIIGAEALVRWRHPELGLVPPLDFIPLAEETGIILAIGEWVLREACIQARTWRQAGLGDIRIAVNLSARQFRNHETLVRLVEQTLNETGLDPWLLELELTESLLMHNIDAALAAMHRLHTLGITFATDDFGTGYSSLSYLKRFPIDAIKIDRSFVRDISRDPDDTAIAQAIIAMAHGLDIKVIAEGVETAKQLAFLRAHRCDAVQGYYFSKPVAAEAMTRMLGKTWRFKPGKTARTRKAAASRKKGTRR